MTFLTRASWAAALSIILTHGTAAQAQDAWIQIEAQSGPTAAERAAAGYAQELDQVAGYRLGATNWYAIVLGPFSEQRADSLRRELRAARAIPADSFVTDGAAFRAQYWPPDAEAGTGTPEPAFPEPVTTEDLAAAPEAVPDPRAEPESLEITAPPEPDETRAEALQSERDLDGQARRDLQIALQWAGFYDAGIDGAFGRGTRSAMAEWQAARGYPDTGVLTTRQRAALIAEYNAVLDGLDFRAVTDGTAGITVKMPTALVEFDSYEPPFAHYGPTDPDGTHKVLLISQRGDRAELHGLFDIMQTLEIVPTDGPREKRDRGFSLTGEGEDFISQTEARLENGNVKGFTLIWPTGDEERRRRVLDEMIDSFETDAAVVMDDIVGEPGENQSVDLLAGLEIRRPEIVRSGFYVSRRGEVLTTSDVAQGCSEITLNNDVGATPVAVDEELGLALLEPSQPLAPRAHAALQSSVPRLNSRAVLAGYSFDGALGAPSISYGELADMRGLNGEEDVKRFRLPNRPGDAGGPVMDESGAVLGLLRASAGAEDRSLPDDVALAADVDTILAFLDGTDVTPTSATSTATLPRGQLERRATDMTVLVGCWK